AVRGRAGPRAALDALEASDVPVRWFPEPAVLDPDAALAPGAPSVHERWPDNVLCRGRVVRGDPEGAIAGAAHTATATMTTSYVEHAYIEPEAGYAEWSEDGSRVTVFACTQTPYMDRDEVASMFKLRPTQVRI